MTLDIRHRTNACSLVFSKIAHTRYGQPGHHFRKPGLSILIDLDRLDEANSTSWLFSVNRFNIVSFYESDFGPNHKSQRKINTPNIRLADYIRTLASQCMDTIDIAKIELLAFPRIFGFSFNPIAVYRCLDRNGQDCFHVYEVHNTFGDSHSYVSVINTERDFVSYYKVDKKLHVSPFFDVEGYYQLAVRRGRSWVNLVVRYFRDKKLSLIATLDGEIVHLSGTRLLLAVLSGHFPLRPLLSIHFEAVKLFFKGLKFHKRPRPPIDPTTRTKEDK